LYVNQQFVEECPIGSGRRSVIVKDQALPAKVEAMLVQPSGDLAYGGSFTAFLPQAKKEIAATLTRTRYESLAVVESSAIGSPVVGLGCVFSSSEYVATCYHLVKTLPGVIVRFADGKTVPVAQVFFDPTSDLAILKLSADSKHLALEPSDPKNIAIGADGNALILGLSGSGAPSVAQGNITGFMPSGDILFSSTMEAAADGAPVLGDGGGLLGIVDGTFGPPDTRGHRVISVEILRRLLKASVP
jgi:S1-C subfamily serine protease